MADLPSKNDRLSQKVLQLEEVSQRRFEKLERIKADIPLKTYHYLKEKLLLEREFVQAQQQQVQKILKHEEQTQTLSKTYFEKHQLKPKLIRID